MGPPKGIMAPLPPSLPVLLTVKAGQRDKSRKTVATYEFEHVLEEGFNVLFSKAANYLDRAVVTHNESPNPPSQGKAKLVKIPSVVKVFLKTSTNATQKEYVCIEIGNYMAAITSAWNNASVRRGGQTAYKLELFVYLKRRDGSDIDGLEGVPKAEPARVLQVPPTSSYEATFAEAPMVPVLLPSDARPTSAPVRPSSVSVYRPLDFLINGQVVPMLVNVEQLRSLLAEPPQPQ
ncbi:hypothetical protein SDRG_06696 [Saprolegnia diclina VS20]|uniref:Uncharacterized protein n=1 Tax=Saprolegnia diclina (strain VS20) TaxID=1156394 RepID=T0RU93_SAPDV|nr:hypothetical protein SDRG_06696 [Saprolegnia diclina VS20]EQC35953.1 hypothetical protein SDRG_06696 [Saprolegnia diclina VS20]|eukprot:XP_008610715.1 hypothetical protein SDRG_06696 [Saprolegnia diclina VS20]